MHFFFNPPAKRLPAFGRGIGGPSRNRRGGFALVEILTGAAIVAIGFLGAYATVIHAGKLVSNSEEESLVTSGIEQRMDQLRTLEWGELTDGTGLTSKIWTARPETVAGLSGLRESMTISAYDLPPARALQGAWNGTGAPSVSFTGGAQPLSAASAVKVVATLTWTGRRSSRQQVRSLVTIISRGGISKSDL